MADLLPDGLGYAGMKGRAVLGGSGMGVSWETVREQEMGKCHKKTRNNFLKPALPV